MSVIVLRPYQDFSSHDECVALIKKAAANSPGKLYWFNNWHLIIGDYGKTLYESNAAERAKLLQQRKALLLTPSVQTCLRAKLHSYAVIQKQFTEPCYQYFSFHQLFTLWVEDLIKLYRFHEPEDSSIDDCEKKLLDTLAQMRVKMENTANQKIFRTVLKEFAEKVRTVVPDADEFFGLYDAYEKLLSDNCAKGDHWDVDVTGVELALYTNGFFKNYSDRIRFTTSITPAVCMNLFQRECGLTLNRLSYVLPLIVTVYENYDKILQSNFQKIKVDICISNGNSIFALKEGVNQFLFKMRTTVRDALEFLSSASMHSIEDCQLHIELLREIICTYSNRDLFCSYENDDAVDPSTLSEQDKRIWACSELHRRTITKINSIFDTNIIDRFYAISQLYEMLLIHSSHEKAVAAKAKEAEAAEKAKAIEASNKAVQELAKEIYRLMIAGAANRKEIEIAAHESTEEFPVQMAAEAASAKKVELDAEASAAKRAEVKAAKVAKAARKADWQARADERRNALIANTQNAAESELTFEGFTPHEAPAISKRPSRGIAVATETFHSFSISLPSETNRTEVEFAAHADLYRQYVHAARSLLKRYERDPTHKLNLRRLSCLAASHLVETAINFQLSKSGLKVDTSTHQLKKIWTVKKEPILKEVVEIFDGASNYARFTHSQARIGCSFNAMMLNSHRALLEGLTDGDSEPELAQKLGHALRATQALGASMKSGKVPKQVVTNRIRDNELFELSEIKSIIAAINKLKKDVWIKQWLDDLCCLDSSLRLLNEALSPEEYSALISHIHFLMHSSVQSPLYALREREGLRWTGSHILIDLFKMMKVEISAKEKIFFGEQLFDACYIARYPYRYLTPKSAMHRIQLESIAMMHTPSSCVNESEEATLSHKLDWTPHLRKLRTPVEQKAQIVNICRELVGILTKMLLPLLEKK